MTELVTIPELEAALGRPPEDAEEEAVWQFYITTLSDFINNYVSVSFSRVTETVRRKASHSGIIELTTPVIEVTSVLDYRLQTEDLSVDFDGICELFYLLPDQVVDVTYTYGYEEVPQDIKNLVLAAVLAQVDETSPIALRAFRVGDVLEEYRDDLISKLFGVTAETTLNKYTKQSWTMDTSGGGWYPNYLGRGYVGDYD